MSGADWSRHINASGLFSNLDSTPYGSTFLTAA